MASMARFAVYVIGLVLVVGAVWVFLTQTEAGQAVPQGAAIAILLLLAGIGVMAGARNINGHSERRVVREHGGTVRGGRVVERGRPEHHVERYEERRYD